jgi:hypothetical protein
MPRTLTRRTRPGLIIALLFVIAFTCPIPDHRVRADGVAEAPVDTVAEAEPNDTPSTPNVVGGNVDFTGNAAASDTGYQPDSNDDFEDWVSLTITQTSTLTATLEVNQADMDMMICRENGPFTIDGSLAHSDGPDFVDEHFSVALQPGVYKIGITAYDPHAPFETTAYTLSLRGGVTTQPGQGDLSVGVTGSPNPAPAGTVVKFIIEARNAGPDPVTATVTAPMPEHTTFSNAEVLGGGSYTTPGPLQHGTVVMTLPDVPVNGSKAGLLFLNLSAEASGAVTLTVSVTTTATDPNSSNNSASSTIVIVPGRIAELTWPAPTVEGEGPPSLTATLRAPGSAPTADELSAEAPAPSAVTGYKVYRSSQPNVQPTQNNIFGSFPPNTTSAGVPVGTGKTYFTVTACYGSTETAKSNEADVELSGPTITNLTVKGSKVTAVGSGFVGPVKVYVNGVEFAAAPKLKKQNTKLVAKGALANGQTLPQVMAAGAAFRIAIENADKGMTQFTVAP